MQLFQRKLEKSINIQLILCYTIIIPRNKKFLKTFLKLSVVYFLLVNLLFFFKYLCINKKLSMYLIQRKVEKV